jgi:hypothetical protein
MPFLLFPFYLRDANVCPLPLIGDHRPQVIADSLKGIGRQGVLGKERPPRKFLEGYLDLLSSQVSEPSL